MDDDRSGRARSRRPPANRVLSVFTHALAGVGSELSPVGAWRRRRQRRRERAPVSRLAASSMTGAPPTDADNPLLAPSTLPFATPPFDRIRDEHFLPAIALGMQQQIAEVDAIAAQSSEPTFENTLEALERSGDVLTRALRAFHAIAGTNTNDTLQDLQVEMAPRLAAHTDT